MERISPEGPHPVVYHHSNDSCNGQVKGRPTSGWRSHGQAVGRPTQGWRSLGEAMVGVPHGEAGWLAFLLKGCGATNPGWRTRGEAGAINLGCFRG